jgi:hypothetical protein
MTTCDGVFNILEREFAFLKTNEFGFKEIGRIDRSAWGQHGYCLIGFESALLKVAIGSGGGGFGMMLGFLDATLDPEQRDRQVPGWVSLSLLMHFLDDPTFSEYPPLRTFRGGDSDWPDMSEEEEVAHLKSAFLQTFPQIKALFSLKSRDWRDQISQALSERLHAYTEESNRRALENARNRRA